MHNFKKFINELFIQGNRDMSKDSYIIAVYDTIYILNEDMNCETIANIIRMVYKRLDIEYPLLEKKLSFLCKKKSSNKIKELLLNLFEYHDDFIIGKLKKDVLFLYKTTYTPEPSSSNIIYKLTKQLNLKSIKYINLTETKIFDNVSYTKNDIKNKIPDIAYHGTTSLYLENILKLGIRPNISSSNYDLVEHKDLIFFTTSKHEAIIYATNTANSINGVPVIIEFKIPDKELIIPDYDVERFSGVDKYYRHLKKISLINSRTYKFGVNLDKFAKEYSFVGYKGVINPIHFISIYLYNKTSDDDDYMNDYGTIKDFSKFSRKEVIDLMKNAEFDKFEGFVYLNFS